jgi:hypothetical protein
MDSVDFWVKRFEHYDDATRSMFEKTIQLVTAALTILIAGAAALFIYGKFPALLVVPVVVVLIWTLAVRLLQEQMMTAAYRDYSEERAMKLLAPGETDPWLIWHSHGGAITTGWVNNFVYGCLGLVSIGLVAGSLWAVLVFAPEVPFSLWITICVASVLGIAGVGAALLSNRRQATQEWTKIQSRALNFHSTVAIKGRPWPLSRLRKGARPMIFPERSARDS